jgi:glucose/arabinose dehydrogenase
LALLLAALIVTSCAAMASLLAWLDTRGRLATASMALFGVVSLVLVAVGFQLRETDAGPALAALTPPVPTPTPYPTPSVAADHGDFVVEAASEAGIFELPTSFTFDDDGSLYVGFERGISKARDLDGDGFFEDVSHFGYDAGWVFGLDFHEGSLYAAIDGSVLRFRDNDGDGVADEDALLTSGLPNTHFGGHSNSGLIVTPEGLIYMTVGGTSDHGPELEPLGGTILTMALAGGTADLLAEGFRNPYDIAFCPDGRLYASDNGPDNIADGVDETAPDEVNLVLPGRNYGYPDYFGPQHPSTGTESPIALLPERAGATGIICHDGAGLPPEYAGNLFVTLWGTFFAPVESGRRVMRVQLFERPDGSVFGVTTELAAGFGNPIDILQEADGNLLVLDFTYGQIFRIRYVGE